ncbi:MAG: hypothetical protein KKA55_11505 [Proteobacteria bacterium]|nr:hypothetical protein [Pseudomonadota bacterium]MBU1596143.1 hypothetical protein [Pseudomonadota bacterium]
MSRRVFPALALALLLAGCRGPVEGLEGDYECERVDTGPARLTLRPDGGGALCVGAEEAPFRWEARGNGVVLLHTRQGGVIKVRLGAGALELDMPGTGGMTFRKTVK